MVILFGGIRFGLDGDVPLDVPQGKSFPVPPKWGGGKHSAANILTTLTGQTKDKPNY